MSQASNGNKRNLVGTTDFGMKLTGGVETLRFNFHNFELLPHARGDCMSSLTVRAHHHGWRMELYPGGSKNSSEKNVNVSCNLRLVDYDGAVPLAKVIFRCNNFQRIPKEQAFKNSWIGHRNFCTREKVISDFLEDGTFTIEVDIQMAESVKWYPEDLRQQATLINLYQSSANADVEFTVESTTFKAHKVVLWDRCKSLHELVSSSASGESIPITGSSPDTFKTLLEYVYTVKEPVLDDLVIAKNVLEEADRFGVIGLKMLAESTIAYKLLSVDNFADILIYAQARSCPLLEEQCMKFYASNAESFVGSEAWEMIKESPGLVCDLLKFVSITSKTITDETKVETLGVATLRKRLRDANLDLDGSREVLVKRLKEHDAETENV